MVIHSPTLSYTILQHCKTYPASSVLLKSLNGELSIWQEMSGRTAKKYRTSSIWTTHTHQSPIFTRLEIILSNQAVPCLRKKYMYLCRHKCSSLEVNQRYKQDSQGGTALSFTTGLHLQFGSDEEKHLFTVGSKAIACVSMAHHTLGGSGEGKGQGSNLL